jgi:hypothetical protein
MTSFNGFLSLKKIASYIIVGSKSRLSLTKSDKVGKVRQGLIKSDKVR